MNDKTKHIPDMILPTTEKDLMKDLELTEPKFPIDRDSLIGKTVTVFTIDGRTTKGIVRSVFHNLLSIENDTGKFAIFTHAISSIFFGDDYVRP